MTQYANIPGFPGYTPPAPAAAPAFPPGPVPAAVPAPSAGIPGPVPAVAGYPASSFPAGPVPGPVPVYPTAPAGPVPAVAPSYPQPYAPAASAPMPPLPDLNAAIAAATLSPDKHTAVRDLLGKHRLKIVDHQRRCGTSKRDGKYFDVVAVDFEVVNSTNPNAAPGIKVSCAFSMSAGGWAQKHEMLRLKTITFGLTGVPLSDPRIDGITAQVYRALAALDGQKPYVGQVVDCEVNPQANGKCDDKGKPYTEVKFGPAQ